MRVFSKALIILIASFLCVVQVSHAHRFYASFTQIDLRDNKKTLEITHRLTTHDVEDILRMAYGNPANLSDAQIELALRDVVERDFALFNYKGERLPLNWIGMDYQTDNVHLYQEAPLPNDPSELTIINRLLMNLFDDQKNTVNVEWNEQIRTNIFVKGNEQQQVSFK